MDNNNNQQPMWQKPSMPEPQAPIRRSPSVPKPQQPVRQNPNMPRTQQPVRQSPPMPRPQQPVRQAQPRAQQPIDRRQTQPRVEQPIDRRQPQPRVGQPIDRRQAQNRLPSEYNKPLNGAQPPVQNASQVGTKPVSQPVNPIVDRKSKKQAKQHQKLQQKATGKGKKKGAKAAIAIALVFAIVVGIVGVAAAVIAGVGGGFDGFIDGGSNVNSGSANVETGAVADVTFRDNIAIISNTAQVQEDFVEVIIEGDEYTLNYGSALPQELSSLSQGEIFCVPSIKDADVNCFAMGFCGEVISSTSNSITFKVPSMEEVFTDFSFHLQGDVAESAEFVPAAGVSVVENRTLTKANFTPLAATMPNITLSQKIDYDTELEIGDYTIKPEFSYVGPGQQSVLPDYSMFCDKLKLKIEVEEDKDGSAIKNSISGTVEMENLATKANIEMHEDENGEMQIQELDVGFMANVKTELEYSGTIGTDLPKIAKEQNFLRKKAENNNVINIKDVTENEKGKLILGSYVIGYDVKLPGLENQVNQISYLSAGLVFQVFVTASGEIEGKFSIEHSGFYSAEYDSKAGYSGQCKGYEYYSPALYTGEYSEAQQDSKPSCKVSFEGEITFNAATGVDFGLCFLGFVPLKLACNFIECDIKLDGTLKTGDIDFSGSDNVLFLEGTQSFTSKSNITLKAHLGVEIDTKIFDTDVKAPVAAFGFEKVLVDKVHYQYPNPIDFDHSQCGFGNIFIGENYTSPEMDDIFRQFEKDHGIDSLLSDLKDGVGNAVIETLQNELSLVLSELDIDLDEESYGSVKYYSSGAMYFLDENNKVVMEIITGDGVCNAAGLSVGIKPHDAEVIYSVPDDSTTIKLDIDESVRLILKESGLDLSGLVDGDITIYEYVAKDTEDEMMLLFADGQLKAIILVDM